MPKSTLLMMVSAFADADFIKEAYHVAIKEKYNFILMEMLCLLSRN